MTLSASSGERLPTSTIASATNRVALFLTQISFGQTTVFAGRGTYPSRCSPPAQASCPGAEAWDRDLNRIVTNYSMILKGQLRLALRAVAHPCYWEPVIAEVANR